MEKIWQEEVEGSSMFQLCSKLKNLKVALRKLNKDHFSDLASRTALAKEKMEDIQRLLQQRPNDASLFQEETRAIKDYMLS